MEELKAIVQRMIDAGEPEEKIREAVRLYKEQNSGKVQSSTVGPTVSQDDMGSKSETGSSGSVNWFDQTWFGRGFKAASTTGEATSLMSEDFSNIDIETIQEFIVAKEQEAASYVESERMKKFQEQYQKEGSTWSAFFRGVKDQPGLIPELFVQSLGTQIGTLIDSPTASLTAAAVGGATGAKLGAAGGSVAGPAGTGIGGLLGAASGAMGGLATSMEAALTFGELIEKELEKEGKEFTDKNIKELLEGPKGNSIRNKAIGRGLAIGTVEGLTGGIAGKVATTTKAAVALARAGKSAKISSLAGVGAGVGVEAIGGGVGEVAGRLAADQEMDPAEIGFEAITGITSAPVNVGLALKKVKEAKYYLNDMKEEVSYNEFKNFVDTASDQDILGAKIRTENDATGIGAKAAKRKNDSLIKSQIDDSITDQKDIDKLLKLSFLRDNAKANLKKEGINKAPNAEKKLTDIEAQIDKIIGKYEGAVDVAKTKDAAKARKSARDSSVAATIAFAEAKGKLIGKDVKVVENDQAAQELHDKLVAEGKAKPQDVTGSDGFIVGDAIVINKDVAGRQGAINVGAHELLHGVLQKHLNTLVKETKDKDGNVIEDKTELKKFISDFKKSLSETQRNYLEKVIKENYKDEIKQAEAKGENFLDTTDEWLTQFIDGIATDQITYDESSFAKIKSFIERIFRKFGYNKEFTSGRQTYDFLKDFQQSAAKFELSARAQAVAGGGVISTETKASKTQISEKAAKISKEVDDIGKKATTKAEYDAGVNIEAYNYLIDKQGLDGLILAELSKRGIDTKADDANVNGVPLVDYMEDVRAKLIPDVLGFNPDKEVTSEGKFGLSGYINKRLKFRMGDVATKAKKTVTGRSLETPVGDSGRTLAETMEDEGDTRLKAFEEEDLSISEQRRAIETEQDKNELKSRYRHKLKNNDGSKLISESIVERIREGIRSTLTKLAGKAASPDFLFNFENTVKRDLKNIVQKAIGTKKQYKDFVLKNMSDIVDFTSVQDLVALERLVGQGKLKGGKKIFTVAIKRLTKIEDIQKAINEGKLPVDAINKSEQGVMLNEKRMPTEEELTAFFFGNDMQEVLGYKLGGSTLGTRKDGLARMIITELAQDAVMETMQEPAVMEELVAQQPDVATDVMVANVAQQINRSPYLKFSKNKQIEAGFKILNKGFNLESKKFKTWTKTVTPQEKGYVIDKWKKREFEVFVQSNNVISQKELDALDKKFPDKKLKLHKKYEYVAADRLRTIVDKLGLDYKVDQPSEKDNAGDVEVKDSNGNVVLSIEIKGDTARGISVNINYKKDSKVQATKQLYGEQQKTIEGKVKVIFENIIQVVEETFGEDAVGFTPGDNLEISKDAIDFVVRGSNNLHFAAHDINETITMKQFAESYQTKKGASGIERKSHVIDMKGRGMVDMNINDAKLKIEGLTKADDIDVDIPLQIRITFGKVKKNGMVTVGSRLEPQLTAFDFPQQDVSLLNKKDNKNISFVENITKDVTVSQNLTKASRSNKSESRGASIFDFDETVGVSENFVIATKGGITKRIPSEQWPLVGETLQQEGYKFDFTDFNKVTKGKPGPLLQKMKNQIEKYGPKNVFILTARAPESANAIHEWLKSEGVNIPLQNITGLGNSTAEAKATWVLDKYANKNYNDIYFVDDALQNVQAVQNMLDQLDIKGKSVQAKIKFSKNMNNDFNKILEEVTGIEAKKRFSDIKARKRGESKGKFRFFIPPSHEDFVGLLYNFMGKGRRGDQHRNFFEQALVRPLNRAYREIDTAKQAIANDYKSLNKKFPDVNNKLTEKTPDGDFTFQDAIRVYLWNKHGYDIPGLTKTDKGNLVDIVMNDQQLQAYAETLNVLSKQDTYVDPGPNWEMGNIRIDLVDATGRVGRASYFTEFNENVDIIFSQENLNKIEAGYGKSAREALEDMLHRIKTGVNRTKGTSAKPNMFMNWLNASVSGVMFFNTRSALLQQMSNVNYLNFADNNIYAAGKAFANQPQYWKDFAMIFNSDMLKQRRGGLQTDINGAELAEAIKKARPGNMFDQVAIITGKALRLGFLPTQIGDNIAIATGGAAFYRNRVNKYIKDGMSVKEAEAAAFTDFQDITQSTQQSARPDMTSQQQASWVGKLILNFLNTPSQYNRIIKKAGLDIINRRITGPNTTQLQSDMSNMSRILYYGAAQNLIFYGLQTALFAVMFGLEDEDEEKKAEQILKKKERVINGSIDTILRGSGIYGVAVSTIKNMVIKFLEQREKGYNKDESAVIMEMLNFSPVVGIKARKIVNAEKTLNYNKKVIDEMETFDIDNPQWSAVTNYVEAITTAPVNRIYQKSINLRNAADNDYTALQRALFFSGYTTWSLNLGDTQKMKDIKQSTKNTNKQINRGNTRSRSRSRSRSRTRNR